MGNTKKEIAELLDDMPNDCLLEEIERELYLRHAMDRAEATGEDCILPYERRLGYHPEMLDGTAKDEVLAVLDLLDGSCSLEDVYYTRKDPTGRSGLPERAGLHA